MECRCKKQPTFSGSLWHLNGRCRARWLKWLLIVWILWAPRRDWQACLKHYWSGLSSVKISRASLTPIDICYIISNFEHLNMQPRVSFKILSSVCFFHKSFPNNNTYILWWLLHKSRNQLVFNFTTKTISTRVWKSHNSKVGCDYDCCSRQTTFDIDFPRAAINNTGRRHNCLRWTSYPLHIQSG